MNTSPAGGSLAALLGAQTVPESSGGEASVADDFTSALAAAAAPQLFAASLEDSLESPPQDMPSAAALAFLSGLLTSVVQPGETGAQETDAQIGVASQAGGSSAQRQAALLSLLGGRTAQIGTSGPVADADAGQHARSELPMLEHSGLQQQTALTDAATDLESLFSVLSGARGAEPVVRPGADPVSLSSLLPAALTATSGGRDIAPEPAVHTAVKSHVGTASWADEVGSRLVMMSLRGQNEGSLTLSPEHLGPLEVRISVSQDRADVWFGAQHADTRAALTDALPRLRELFAASGLSLGQAGVSHDMPRQEGRASGTAAMRGGAEDVDAPAAAAASPVAQTRGLALLDTWA